MADQQVVHLTREGYEKFEAELNYLRTVRRSEVAERLRRALEEGGDLVENAEYEDAKNEQAFVEGRIQQLETLLSRAQIIEEQESSGPNGVVQLNSVVTVQEEGGEPRTFHLVGRLEANPSEGKISDESPLGRALLGKQAGDTVVVEAPDGQFEYRILSVN
ncbi:MAG TPA: transcription elongation factor GreA [Chloroflexi bacterium]|nr:transcription elongation factor GreA [Chloroflexota bacterium]